MRDQFGLVPPHIKQNYKREEMVDRQIASASNLLHALRGIDRRLDVVFVSDRADPEYGVVPGRWHVVRHNDGAAPDSYMAITGRNGEYREPDSGVIDEIQRRDMWNRGIPEVKGVPAAKRDYARDEALLDELAHDVRAGARVAGEGGLTKRKWGRG